MLVGVHENRNPALTKEDYPRAKLYREFIPGVLKPQSLVDRTRRIGEPVWDAGGVLVISFKPDLSAVARGQWDAHLRDYATWLKDEAPGPCFVVPWHEPENDMTAKQFVEMFNRVRRVMKEVYPQLTVIHSAMAYQYRPGGKADKYDEWLTEADLNTCDVYSGKSFPLGQILPEHPGFKRWLQMVGGRTWGITERGFHADAQSVQDCKLRANTIMREADWLAKTPSCTMYIYWNTSGTENNPDLIVADTKGEEALRYLTETLGGGTPVPPLPDTKDIVCPTCKGKGKLTVIDEDS